MKENLTQADNIPEIAWQVAVILGIYRLVLVAVLALVYLAFFLSGKIYFFDWSFLLLLAVAYAGLASLLLYWLTVRRYKITLITMIGGLADVIILTLLMTNNRDLLIAYGLLMNITIAAASIILAGRLSLFLAAFAAISVLCAQMYLSLHVAITLDLIQRTGFLCITFFVIAVLTLALSNRIRQSEAIARQQGQNIATLEKINAAIVQNMEQGVVVINEEDRVIIANKAFWYLLGAAQRVDHPLLSDFAPQLMTHLIDWRTQPNDLQLNKTLLEMGIVPHFIAMTDKNGQRTATLILLEDTVALSKEAQQIKLASLGRLTASIAHEIRNPLSSISHAVQLLLEEKSIANSERRLCEIIKNNSNRVNQIIESILQLSRRKEAAPTIINLQQWLPEFIESLTTQYNEPIAVTLEIDVKEPCILFDVNQLHQALHNLCDNGLLYSKMNTGKSELKIHVSQEKDGDYFYMDIIDKGIGIDEKNIAYIFEPFFTTKKTGTGLGLYIARELCQANGAKIYYFKDTVLGSCFRIVFNRKRVGH